MLERFLVPFGQMMKNPSLNSTALFPITPLHTLEILAVTQGDWVLTVIPLSSFYWGPI